MSQEQNYQVNYTINVEATEGTKKVQAFADSVKNLILAKNDLTPAIKNIQKMVNEVDKIFRTKGGKKRDYTYKMDINTSGTEEKLGRVKTLLTEIGELSKGINLVINAGQAPLDTKKIKSNAKTLLDKKLSESRKAEIEKSAAASVKTMMETQKRITKAVGKINAALVTLEKGREVNIKTDVAKERLKELLGLMRQLKGASKMTMGVQMGSPSSGKGNVLVAPQTANTLFHPPLLYNPEKPYVLSPKASEKLQEKLVTNRELAKQKAEQRRADEAVRLTTQKAVIEAKGKEWDRQRQVKANEAAQRKAASDAARAIREKTRLEQQGAARAVTAAQRQQRAVVTGRLISSGQLSTAYNMCVPLRSVTCR